MEKKLKNKRLIKTFMIVSATICCISIYPSYPGDKVCEIKNKKGDVIFSCSPMENETCSKTYLGNTLTCNIVTITSILLACSYLITKCNKTTELGNNNAFINLNFLSCLEIKEENAQNYWPEKLSKDFILLYSLNGDCPACIIEFIKWLKVWSEKKIFNNCITVLMVNSKNKNTDLIIFFMEKYNITLPQNSFIFLNVNNCFEKFNPLFEKSKASSYLFLLKKTGEIITEIDLFDYRKSLHIFKKSGILSR